MSVKRGAASRNLDLMWRRPGKPCVIDWQATGNCVPVGTRNGLVVGATLFTQGGSHIFYARGRQKIRKNTTTQSGNYDRCQARLANKRYAVSRLRCSMPTRASDIRGRRALGCRSTHVMKKTAARQELSTTRDDESVRAIPEKCLARARKPFGRPFRPDFPNTKSRILPAGPKRISLAQRCSGTTLAGQSCWVCTAEVAQTQASPRCSGRPCNVWLSTLREVILSNWPRRMKSWSWSAEPDTAL